MSPALQGQAAARSVYATEIGARFDELDQEALKAKVTDVLGVSEGVPQSTDALPEWLLGLDQQSKEARASAEADARVARFVSVGVLLLFLFVYVLADIACRNRIKRTIQIAEDEGVQMEAA